MVHTLPCNPHFCSTSCTRPVHTVLADLTQNRLLPSLRLLFGFASAQRASLQIVKLDVWSPPHCSASAHCAVECSKIFPICLPACYPTSRCRGRVVLRAGAGRRRPPMGPKHSIKGHFFSSLFDPFFPFSLLSHTFFPASPLPFAHPGPPSCLRIR